MSNTSCPGPLGKGCAETEYVMYIRGMDVEAEPGAEVLASKVLPYFDRTYQHFCSHRQTPSSGQVGGPAVVQQGRAIYFANPIFTEYNAVAPRWEKQLFLNALDAAAAGAAGPARRPDDAASHRQRAGRREALGRAPAALHPGAPQPGH